MSDTEKIISLEELKTYHNKSKEVLNKVKGDLETAISAEETRAKAAEQANTTAINNEKTRAQTKENSLTTDIANERTRAEGAEGTLRQDLASEVSARNNADAVLQTQITSNKNRLDNIENTDTGIIVDNSGVTIKKDATIMGDLNVKGTTTTVDQETIQAKANILVTNSDATPLVGYTGVVALTGDFVVANPQPTAITFKENTYYVEDSETAGGNKTYKLADRFEAGETYYIPAAIAAPLLDPGTKTLVIGEGVYEGGEFRFTTGQEESIATRADDIAPGNLVAWDDDKNMLVDANLSAEGIQELIEDELEPHLADTNNPHSVTATQVGLGNVDNTSDQNKPVSIAVQAELDILDGKITDEYDRATGIEGGLNTRLGVVEADYLTSTDKTELQGNIDAEELARQRADSTLQGLIEAEAGRADGVEKGLAQRVKVIEDDYLVAADKTELQGNINAEATARGNADTALGNRITVIENEIQSGTSAQNPLTNKSYVDDKITALDNINESSENGKYVDYITETDGIASSHKKSFDTTISGASTDNNAPTSLGVYTFVNTEVNGAKAYTDAKIKSNAFTICTTDQQMFDLLVEANLNEYVRFDGESDSGYFEKGCFYVIQRVAEESEDNDWEHVNEVFEAERANLQSTASQSTTLVADVLGQGRIDIKQTSDRDNGASLTSPVNINGNPGTTAVNNPRATNNDRAFIYSDTHSGLGSASSYKRIKIGPGNYTSETNRDDWILPNRDESIKLRCQDYREPGVDNRDNTFTYNAGDGIGVAYALVTNWYDYPEPADRTALDNLTSNIRGSHTIRISDTAQTAQLKIDVQLAEFVEVYNIKSGASKANAVYGSIWLKYKTNNGATLQTRVFNTGINVPIANIPEGTSDYTKVDQVTGAKQTATIDLPIANTYVQNGYRDYEIIEVLEVYKDLEATHALISEDYNYLNAYGFAAFTDMRLLTTVPAIIAKEPYAAKSQAIGDLAAGVSADGKSMIIQKYNLDGELVGTALEGIQKAITPEEITDDTLVKTIGFDANGNLKKANTLTIAGTTGAVTLGNGLALDANLELDVVNKVPTPEANKVLRTDNNGTIVWLDPPQTGVTSLGGKTGAITLDSGLDIDNNNQLYIVNKVPTPAANKVLRTDANNNIVWLDPPQTGVTSIGTKTGDITLGAGLSIDANNELTSTVRIELIDLL